MLWTSGTDMQKEVRLPRSRLLMGKTKGRFEMADKKETLADIATWLCVEFQKARYCLFIGERVALED